MRLAILPAAFAACASLGLVGCAGSSGPSRIASTSGPQFQTPKSAPRIDPVLRRKILALNPERISEAEIAQVLSGAPAPRIISIHGGVYPVHLLLKDFASFLMRMGYPGNRVRLPDGDRSYSCYMPSEKLAGAAAWFYEETGMPVIMVGHSQGGVQVIKTLHLLSGSFGGQPLHVWNPVTKKFEDRTMIRDPRRGIEVPVKTTQPVIHANVVGAGGATLLMPNQWGMKGLTRKIPDSTAHFTGYFVPTDFLGGGLRGPEGSNRYRPIGNAKVRNVVLSHGSEHITVPRTRHLAKSAASRRWIHAYHPSQGDALPAGYDGPRSNLLWAANTWYEIKKYWCLALQEYVRRQG